LAAAGYFLRGGSRCARRGAKCNAPQAP
jgi:hypothetical protein